MRVAENKDGTLLVIVQMTFALNRQNEGGECQPLLDRVRKPANDPNALICTEHSQWRRKKREKSFTPSTPLSWTNSLHAPSRFGQI